MTDDEKKALIAKIEANIAMLRERRGWCGNAQEGIRELEALKRHLERQEDAS